MSKDDRHRNGTTPSNRNHLQIAHTDTPPSSPSQGKRMKYMVTLLRSSKRKDTEFADADFSNDMSPLLLAAKLERHDILKLLMERVKPDVHPISSK